MVTKEVETHRDAHNAEVNTTKYMVTNTPTHTHTNTHTHTHTQTHTHTHTHQHHGHITQITSVSCIGLL